MGALDNALDYIGIAEEEGQPLPVEIVKACKKLGMLVAGDVVPSIRSIECEDE